MEGLIAARSRLPEIHAGNIAQRIPMIVMKSNDFKIVKCVAPVFSTVSDEQFSLYQRL